MQPKPQSRDAFELFQSHFDQLLNPAHELIQLALKIDWGRFEAAYAGQYSPDMGAPGKATRLMVGLHYLKHTFNESDGSVVARWVENPYWQSFCGYTHMQNVCPIHPTSMTKWRKRVGPERLQEMQGETIAVAHREGHVSKTDLERVNVDTTVQEKNITFPTDSKLLYEGICKLVKAAKSRGLELRQSYLRVGRIAAIKVSRYAHARQFKRMQRSLRKLRTYVGRLIRDIRRKVGEPDEALTTLLERADRIRQQRPHDTHKLYSLHEPEVQCISKGKAHKRYEFGQKVAIATTNHGNWTVAARLLPGNPYDGHTLAETLAAVESVTGVAVTDAYVDKGYRGHGVAGPMRVHVAGQHGSPSRAERKRRRRRSAIEPKIGHLKSDHRMDRCFLKGLTGDAINAVLAAAGSNLQKLLRRLAAALIQWLELLLASHSTSARPALCG
ncbi:MAG: IS5 family transposase [Planctomycetes bacterium]|nr:IS5 family transposase [Planctomycetota bacterium]